MKNIILILLVFLLCGCVGTVRTRHQPNSDFVGKYPYSAVALDVAMAVSKKNESGIANLVAIISIPFDIAYDTVLLVPDLVAWPLKMKKVWAYSTQQDDAREPATEAKPTSPPFSPRSDDQ